MLVKCPECRGIVRWSKFEVTCRKCGLVIKEPICIGGIIVFE